MKKGFTLIELLAVIVILALIALIAVPLILGIIDKAKKGALEDSAYGLIEAANIYYSQNLENSLVDTTFNCDKNGCTRDNQKLNYKGNIDGTGTLILFTDGKIALCIHNEKYSVIKNISDRKVIISTGTCSYDEETSSYYNIGTVSQKKYDDMVSSYEQEINDLKNSQLNTSDATAIASDLLAGKTAYVNGVKISGNISTYDGITNIIPTTTTQVLNTAGKILNSDITISPVSSFLGSLTYMNGNYAEGSGDRTATCSATIPKGSGWITISNYGWGCGNSYITGTGTCYGSERTRICFGFATSNTVVTSVAYAQSCSSNQTASCTIYKINN
ncbi:MAG: type II secretion system protein [Bacilli bacterium]|nr:type II secretion system protein [Bacilli bacterium]